jgi:hypothetical protein
MDAGVGSSLPVVAVRRPVFGQSVSVPGLDARAGRFGRWPPRLYPPPGAGIPVIDAHPRNVGTSRTLAITAVPCVNTVAMPRRLPCSEAKAAPSVWPNLYLSSARIETLHRIIRKWKQARYGSEVRTVYTPNSLKGPYWKDIERMQAERASGSVMQAGQSRIFNMPEEKGS